MLSFKQTLRWDLKEMSKGITGIVSAIRVLLLFYDIKQTYYAKIVSYSIMFRLKENKNTK